VDGIVTLNARSFYLLLRVNKLKQVEKLQQEKSEIQGKLKNEKNLGTQVQLNT
jgi:hypothetical protein